MSEQEKKSGGNAGGSTVVSVEQTAALHKQPYRPIELEEDSHDPHHKRSRAPAVPCTHSVAENLKRAEESNASGVERKEQSEELTTERKKFSAGKKISSKKRDSQPETIPMAVIDPEKKTEGKGLSQPIPPDVASMASTHPRADKEKHADEDSIAEDVAELRTPGTEAARSEWSSQDDLVNQVSAQILKKSESSWNDEGYLAKVQLQDVSKPSRSVLLERKASVGPCKSNTPFTRPSGVMICVPKRSSKSLKEGSRAVSSGINLSIPGNFLDKSKPGATVDTKGTGDIEKRAVKVDIEFPYMKVLSVVRTKVDIMRNKIQSVFSA